MFKIYSPSYKRADVCKTHKYIPSVTYVVRESEAEDYKGVHDKLWIVPDSAQGNVARIRNYMLENAPEDNIVFMDDDIKHFGRFNGNELTKLDNEGVLNMIQEGMQLAKELGTCYWGINLLQDKGAYREYTPFGTKQMVLGPFCGHMKNPFRYDEKIYLKEDYDMSLQVLNKYRKTLRMNMYHYVCDQATLRGGCADARSVSREMEHIFLLQKKWGNDIVKLDNSNKSNKNKTFDINPIIKVPIKGV